MSLDHLRDLAKKDDAQPAAVYRFRDITKPPTPTPDPLQKIRIVTESLVYIVLWGDYEEEYLPIIKRIVKEQ